MVKNRIFLLGLGLSLLIITGCKGKDTPDINDQEEVRLEDPTEDQRESLENPGEEAYHPMILRQSIFETGSQKDSDLIKEPHGDIGQSLQWLADHFLELSQEDRELLLFIMGYLKDEETGRVPWFSLPVHADEVEKFPMGLSGKDYLILPNGPIGEGKTVLLMTTFEDEGQILGLPIGYQESPYPIVISAMPLALGVESGSFLMPSLQLDDLTIPETFFITINSNLSDDRIKGALLHELFHSYQFDMGYKRRYEAETFLMESTAIWAVANCCPELDYPHDWDLPILMYPLDFNVEAMDEDQMKSWYQLYQVANNELSLENFTKQMLEKGLSGERLVDLIRQVIPDSNDQHEFFVKFGQMMYGDRYTENVEMMEGSSYQENRVDDAQFDIMSLDDLLATDEDTGFAQKVMDLQGYYPVLVNVSDQDNAVMDIVSDFTDPSTGNQTGLIVMAKDAANKWQMVLSGKPEALSCYLNFGQRPIDELLFVFFNYGESRGTQNYAVNLQERIKGEGTITVTIHEVDDSIDDSPITSRTADYQLVITEDIELLPPPVVPDGEDPLAYNMSSLIMGNVYYIKNFQAIVKGIESTIYDDGGSVVSHYDGTYTYKDGDAGVEDLPSNLLSFNATDLFDNNQLQGSLSDVNDMLESNQSALGDLSGLMGDLQSAQNDLNSLLGSGQGADASSALAAAGFVTQGAGKLNRIKEIMASDVYQIYPMMPPTMISSEWIDQKEVVMVMNSDNQLESTTNNQKVGIPFQAFPAWFVNPDYDESSYEDLQASLPKDPTTFANEIKSTSQAMDMVAKINGKLDRTNVFSAFGMGSYTYYYETDKDGTVQQEITYDEGTKLLHGNIVTNYKLGNTKYEVTIELSYGF